MCETKVRGTALIVSMTVVVVLSFLSLLFVQKMLTRSRNVDIETEEMKAFEAAEAGIDMALNDINTSPSYRPMMTSSAATASRSSTGTVPLATPSGKPLYVHVPYITLANGSKRKIGCIGTDQWTSADDLDGNGRPTWRSGVPLLKNMAAILYTQGISSGEPRYWENHITPQVMGDVAFFTWTVDWFHDGVDNNGDGTIDDRNERNKYTIYSTGIHRGINKNGVSKQGYVVTIEVNVQSIDQSMDLGVNGGINLQLKPK
ncbi:MAG TPA: hypothetical protein VGP72_32730 [Planctomycetota bacterium]|jgi:type II secretory pathway pseudopilin PulG